MKDKKGAVSRIDAFFNGKGFYIVLFACIAVIAVSAWSMINGEEKSVIGEKDFSAEVGIDSGLSAFLGSDIGVMAEAQEPSAEAVAPVREKAAPTAETVTPLPEPEQETVSETAERPFVWPVTGEISLEYSVDYPVYNKTMADWRTHGGIDVEAEAGTRVLACCAGDVTDVYDDAMLGTCVIIDHGGGLASACCSLADVPVVSVGDTVKAGDVIGSVGNTAVSEASEPSHLHFAMTQDGDCVNPLDYLP